MNKTKITTIIGTRPEMIRMSEIIKKFDLHFQHRLIHTGQNSDPNLKDIFFTDLDIREPDAYFGCSNSSLGSFLGDLFIKIERELIQNRPDAIVILGDTNSSLAVIVAKRSTIPVYHLEAGNRSFDANVPEEINRKIVDHTSDFNLVYSELARNNLISEGVHPRKMALIGSPLQEVLEKQNNKIQASNILERMSLEKDKYFLVSIHRQENVDTAERLNKLLHTIQEIETKFNLPVLVSTHPRTRKMLTHVKTNLGALVNFHDPFGFHDYLKLQLNARIVLSDSGSISEESAILGFKALTLRNSMERPEALEAGTILLAGLDSVRVLEAIDLLELGGLSSNIPAEYQIPDTSTRVVNFIFSTVGEFPFWSGLRIEN